MRRPPGEPHYCGVCLQTTHWRALNTDHLQCLRCHGTLRRRRRFRIAGTSRALVCLVPDRFSGAWSAVCVKADGQKENWPLAAGEIEEIEL